MAGSCSHCGRSHPPGLPRCPVTGEATRLPGPCGSALQRYRVEEWIGGGGFAGVYLARQAGTDRPVAVKLLHLDRARDAESAERLVREARTAASVSHPNIVEVLDAGVSDDGRPFVVMELVEGTDLHEVLDRRTRLPHARAIRIGLQILDALAAAHDAGVVHRDIKPANVMLEGTDRSGAPGEDRVKLLDFGLSTLPGQLASTRLTASAVCMGTPGYMAPEQLLSARDVDHRADVYSACALLYRAIGGRLPFDADTYAQLVLEVFGGRPTPLRELAPESPRHVCDAVDRGLAKDADARWQSAEQVAAALRGQVTSADGPTDRVQLPEESRQTLPDPVVPGPELRSSSPTPSVTVSPLEETVLDEPSARHRSRRPWSHRGRRRSAFVGRERQLADLARFFGEEDEQIVTLLGPGGIGKTRLAQRFAETSGLTAWPCDLADATSVEDVCAAVRLGLDVLPQETAGEADPATGIGDVLALRGTGLLVLDDVERVAEAAAPVVDAWASAAPEVRILITSRQRLGIPGEVVYEVPPLGLPDREADPLETDAVRLLVDRVRRLRRDFTVRDEDAEKLSRLVRMLDGIPLALELAAPRLAMLGVSELLERMGDRFSALGEPASPRPARQATLESAIEWSWELLDETERQALTQCSVFRGGFTVDAAERILSLEGGRKAVIDVLSRLRDKSVLHFLPPERSGGEPRLGCYQSIRDFAAAELEQLGDPEAVRRRHAIHYVRVCHRWASGEGDEASEDARVRRLVLERDNLVHAVEWAASRTARSTELGALAAGGLVALGWLATAGGDVATAVRCFDQLLPRIEHAVPDHLHARLAFERGRLMMETGAFEAATEPLGQARELALAVGDARLTGQAGYELGTAYGQAGRLDEAQRLGWRSPGSASCTSRAPRWGSRAACSSRPSRCSSARASASACRWPAATSAWRNRPSGTWTERRGPTSARSRCPARSAISSPSPSC